MLFRSAQIFRVAEADVDASMRRVAKTVNFGVIYGLSAFGLAARMAARRPGRRLLKRALGRLHPDPIEHTRIQIHALTFRSAAADGQAPNG